MKFTYLWYLFKTTMFRIEPVHWLIAIEISVLIIQIIREFRDQKKISRSRYVSMGLLAGYMYIVLASLVLTRRSGPVSTYQIHFLWSYIRILQGSRICLWQNVLNIILFIPIGFLLRPIRPDWKRKYIIAFGLFYSILLEILQLILHRGLFEFDDMLNNTIGVFVGVVMFDVIAAYLLRWHLNESKINKEVNRIEAFMGLYLYEYRNDF